MTHSIDLAPVVLFVYSRVEHTEKTIEALKRNHLSDKTEIIIYSDASRNSKDIIAVQKVRDYLKTISGFKSVKIIERENNLGLAKSIIDGVTTIVNEYGKIIVLEDDLSTSEHFLTYMNNALNLYLDDDRIVSIHGYVYPVSVELPEAFFLLGADCWGWATWKRGWDIFNADGKSLFKELKCRNLLRKFDFDGAFPYSRMLKAQIKGVNDSWAIRWYASAFLAGKLTLYPGRSLIHNIGNDNSGTHCDEYFGYDVRLSKSPITLNNIRVEQSFKAREAFVDFFKRSKMGILERILHRIKSLIKKINEKEVKTACS